MRRAWIWVASSLLLALGLVSLFGTYAFRAVVVHGEPLSFCMSWPVDAELRGEAVVRWGAPLIPFGIECEYEVDSASVVEFHDFGTPFLLAGLAAVVLAVLGFTVAMVRARSRLP